MRQIPGDTLVRDKVAHLRDGVGIESLANYMWGKQATDWMLPVLWGIARKYRHGVFAEIGTRSGTSTLALALAARDVGGRVYTMDISTDYHDDAVYNIKTAGLADYVTFLHGDSRTTDFPEKVDVLFIDGDHVYETVKADFERHKSNVNPSGVILFHDTESWKHDVGRFVEEIGGYSIPIEAGLGLYCKNWHCAGEIISR